MGGFRKPRRRIAKAKSAVPTRDGRKALSGPISRILCSVGGFPPPEPRSFLWARGHPRARAADPEMSRSRRMGRAPSISLFGLAPHGVYPAPSVAVGAVRSYRTVSPLPSGPFGSRKAVCSLWHFPSRRRDRGLPGMPPVGSSDFPLRLLGAITWPAQGRADSSSSGLPVPGSGRLSVSVRGCFRRRSNASSRPHRLSQARRRGGATSRPRNGPRIRPAAWRAPPRRRLSARDRGPP
jgi:hypothetical protein